MQSKPPAEKIKEEIKEEPADEKMEVEELAVAFSTQRLSNVEDIDSQDADNPQLVSEYVCDIYAYLRSLEVRLRGLEINPSIPLSPCTVFFCWKNIFFINFLQGKYSI